MLDIFEKDYIMDTKTGLNENSINELKVTKERTDDPVRKANIDKQIANMKIKIEQTRNTK